MKNEYTIHDGFTFLETELITCKFFIILSICFNVATTEGDSTVIACVIDIAFFKNRGYNSLAPSAGIFSSIKDSVVEIK